MLEARKQIAKRAPGNLSDRVRILLRDRTAPFSQLSHVAGLNLSSMPLLPQRSELGSPDATHLSAMRQAPNLSRGSMAFRGEYTTEVINKFLPNDPVVNEMPNSDAVIIMSEIIWPKDEFAQQIANDQSLQNLLVSSRRPAMKRATPEARPELFLRSIALGCSVTIFDNHIRGQQTVNLYNICKQDLGDFVGMLLAMNTRTKSGNHALRHFLQEPKTASNINVRAVVDDLREKHADFVIYHDLIKPHSQELVGIINIDARQGLQTRSRADDTGLKS